MDRKSGFSRRSRALHWCVSDTVNGFSGSEPTPAPPPQEQSKNTLLVAAYRPFSVVEVRQFQTLKHIFESSRSLKTKIQY